LPLGEQDEEVPVETADFAKRVMTQTRSLNIVRVPTMNHFIAWTRSDVVKAEILAHVKSAER